MAGVFLNIGSGDRPLPRFLNIDLEDGADIRRDVTTGLPFPDGSIRGYYSEHFIEHISQRDALRLLRECRRTLEPGGRIRLATPDLAALARDYLAGDRDQAMLEKFDLEWVANGCELFNGSLRWWGHQWVYDQEELVRIATAAGLLFVGRCDFGASDWPEFRDLEWRPESLLILEFAAPVAATAEDPQPRISVTIPAYNPEFFDASLQSVLDQDADGLEVIICDDAPGSEIEARTRRIAGVDARVRYVRNERNLGDYGNYLNCFARARGRYLKIMNDDDVLGPGALSRMADILDREPGVSLVTSYRERIDEHDQVLPPEPATRCLVPGDSLLEGTSLAHYMMHHQLNVVGEPSCVLFRRADLMDQRPDFMSFAGRRSDYNVDVGMWLTLLSRGDAVYLSDPLCRFRIHSAQAQQAEGAREQGLRAWERHTADAVRWGLHDPNAPAELDRIPWPDRAAHRRRGGWGRLRYGDDLITDLFDPAAQREVYAAFAAGDLPRAAAGAEALVAEFPRAPLLWNDLGAILFAQGEPHPAARAVEQALQLDPACAAALANRAAILSAQGDREGCLHNLRLAADSPRASTTDLLDLADQFETLGEELDSVRALERIMAREPGHPGANQRIARRLQAAGAGAGRST